MKLYICLMPFIGSVPGEQSLAGGVNAPLRLIPRDPSDFRVMAPFHHAGGLPCEAELKPFAAAGLMSDIVRVLNQGNRTEERRVGEGGVSKLNSWWWPYNDKKKNQKHREPK